MIRMPFFLRRTLARRMLVTLFVAFVILWFVMLVQQLIEINRSFTPDTLDSAQGYAQQVEHIDDPVLARNTVEAISVSSNDGFRHSKMEAIVMLELSDRDGKVVYRSPEAGNMHLAVFPAGLSNQTIAGFSYNVSKVPAGRWTLVYVTPVWSLCMLVQTLGEDLWIVVLLEFPFVLLPVWFTMWRGLAPLRKLSAELSTRGKDDLAPIVSEAKYEDMKPLTQALDNLLSQLREKVEREHAFVQDAAHELRTPLAVISAQAHVLALAATPEEKREAEERMDHAVGRASRLVQQLLQLARAEGLRPLENEAVDLATLVRQQLASAVPSAIERDIDLSCEAPEKLPVRVEREAFQSILQNLLDNALRYVHRGGQVIVELCMEGGRCILTVADNGPGIAAAEHARVFERFYRPAGQDVSGSGLGLSIVKHAAERLGGGVRLSSGLGGRGCRFAVSIPLAD